MSEKSKLSSGRHVDPQRRKLLKLSAAAGVSVIASPWMFQSSRAAPRPVKIGMVSPETGPITAFGEAVFDVGHCHSGCRSVRTSRRALRHVR